MMSPDKAEIIYLSYDGMTDNLGQSQVLPYLCGLSKLGMHYTIISFEKTENYTTKKKTIETIVSQNNISWKHLFYTKRPPVLSTVYDIYRLIKSVRKEIKTKKIAAIHCRSYITALVGLYFKKKYNIPFIFDMRGFWADERVEGNVWNLNNFIFKQVYNFFKKKEKEFLTTADHVVSLTQNAKQEIISWKLPNFNPNKITVIPCCADLDFFSAAKYSNSIITETKKQLGIQENDFVVSYLGSVGTWYMLNEMLDFFVVLKKHKANAKFFFITGDHPQQVFDAAAQKNIAVTDIIVKKANRDQVPVYALTSNISLFFIKPSFSKKASSPTKMGELMGLGIPVICNTNVGDIEEIMQPFKDNCLITEFNNHEYEKICSKIDGITALDKQQIITIAKNYYELTKGVEKYFSIYKTLQLVK